MSPAEAECKEGRRGGGISPSHHPSLAVDLNTDRGGRLRLRGVRQSGTGAKNTGGGRIRLIIITLGHDHDALGRDVALCQGAVGQEQPVVDAACSSDQERSEALSCSEGTGQSKRGLKH